MPKTQTENAMVHLLSDGELYIKLFVAVRLKFRLRTAEGDATDF